MEPSSPLTPEVDLHLLELRFADARLLNPRAIEALARSIEQSGQLIACIAVPEATSNRLIPVSYTHLDVYKRQASEWPAQFPWWVCLAACRT